MEMESQAVEAGLDVACGDVIAGGVGRVNAAASTTQTVLERGPYDAVISIGVAGALPDRGIKIRDIMVATSCIYFEEGLITDDGFADLGSMGLTLGDFPSNAVPVDAALRTALSGIMTSGPIATVATCSGSDAAAAEVVDRTGAIAEAMEGAAVVHAARRLGVAAIEIRSISNLTGTREFQKWDLPGALAVLTAAMPEVVDAIAAAVDHTTG